jgi:hypothetical protein
MTKQNREKRIERIGPTWFNSQTIRIHGMWAQELKMRKKDSSWQARAGLASQVGLCVAGNWPGTQALFFSPP